MKMRQLLLAIFSLLVGWGTFGVAQAAPPAPSSKAPVVSFEAGDRSGKLFYVYKHWQLDINRVCAWVHWRGSAEIPRRHCSRRNGGVSLV